MSSFFGVPSEDTATMNMKNLYAGLMLGLVFGFLDNLGLFVGMDHLEDWHDLFAKKLVGGLTYRRVQTDTTFEERKKKMIKDMQAGLGNTFSDVVGVVIGSCVLEASKSGLGVDASFWPLDIVSMAVGCLMGVVLPAIFSNSGIVEDEYVWMAQISAAALALAILFATIPAVESENDPFFYVSVCFMLVSIVLGIRLLSVRWKCDVCTSRKRQTKWVVKAAPQGLPPSATRLAGRL